jgi:Ice-binding-like
MKTKKNFSAITIIMVLALLLTSSKALNKTAINDTNMENQTIIPAQHVKMQPVLLGAAANYALLSGSYINNNGITSVAGDMGISPGTSIEGFPPGVLIGNVQNKTILASQAQQDLEVVYNDIIARRSTDAVPLSGNIGGLTLTPGLYYSKESLEMSTGDLTFDAQGNPDAVFIIQVASSLSVTNDRKMLLKGSASASNIFWQVGSSASFGAASVIKGTVIAMESITFYTGATLIGKALARKGGIVLATNTIVRE